MSLIWMIVIGAGAAAAAKLLMAEQSIGGLFVLGIGGAMIAGTIQYSQGNPAGFVIPAIGAVILLGIHALIGRREDTAKTDREDFRKAA